MNESIPLTKPTENPRSKYKRSMRNILIHKPMQREFSLMLIGLLMVATVAIGWVIHHTIYDAAFGTGGYHFGKVSPYEILSDVSYVLLVRVSAILFFTIVVIGVFGIFFLHRVAGPVYRFRLTFMKLNDGEVPHPLRLREGDFFSEAAIELNRFLEQLRFEKNKSKDLQEKVDQVLRAGTGHPAYETAQAIQSILKQEPKLVKD